MNFGTKDDPATRSNNYCGCRGTGQNGILYDSKTSLVKQAEKTVGMELIHHLIMGFVNGFIVFAVDGVFTGMNPLSVFSDTGGGLFSNLIIKTVAGWLGLTVVHMIES